MQTRVFTTHVPIPLAEQVDALAEQMERPRGWIIKQALKQWVDMETLKQAYVKKGLADVKAGRVATHGEMKEWIKGLRKKKKHV